MPSDIESSCGDCCFHDRAGCNNSNGKCTNPESRWHDIVTGQQGCCDGYQERQIEVFAEVTL